MKKPNILFIFTDQHIANSLSCYDSQYCETPNLDRLAARGTTFDNAYTTCPICTPARASLHTGLYPHKHGMQTNIFMHGCMLHELADKPELLSRRLVEAGYAPYFTGKWHLGYGKEARESEYFENATGDIEQHLHDVELPDAYKEVTSLPTSVGFQGDDFPGHGGGGHAYPQYKEYLKSIGKDQEVIHHMKDQQMEVTSGVETTIDYFLTERAKHWMDKGVKGDKPYCLMLNYWGPHAPYYVPKEFYDKYRDMEFEPWDNFRSDLSNKPRIHDVTRDPNRPWEVIQTELRFYYAYVSYIDWEIGRLLDHLESTGTADETVVMFTADHGDSLGIHRGLYNKAMHMYEPTNRIPLIIADPREKGAQRNESFANITDVYSTILDLAGVSDEKNRRHGRSLLPLVRGETPSDWPETVVTECSGIQSLLFTQRAIRKGDWKYVFNCGDVDELYNLKEDPSEMDNLAVKDSSKEKLLEMQKILEQWMIEKDDKVLHQYRTIRQIA